MERTNQEPVCEDERKYAYGWLDRSGVGEMLRYSGLEMKRTGEDSWTATRVDGQSLPVNFTEDPVAELDHIQACQEGMENRPNITIYTYGYLENGKVFTVEKSEQFCPNVGLTILSLSHSSIEVDETDRYVWVQKVQNPRKGLTCIITIKQTRK